MPDREKRVLSIAGFDPSSGAGVLADCATFQKIGVPYCAVTTAVTWQNSTQFFGLEWKHYQNIQSQIKALENEFQFDCIKIGLIKNMFVLTRVLDYVTDRFPDCKIIWDPVLTATAGYVFQKHITPQEWQSVARQLYLVTPNLNEVQTLCPDKEPIDGAIYLSEYMNTFLKGGHAKGEESVDTLYYSGDTFQYNAARINGTNVHGTGCVLSAAITAYLYQGHILPTACEKAKEFVTNYIQERTFAHA